ncbi:MAG: hypothetical protein MUC60_15345 [Oscillatoria sp. Prado101]|nr:hypothetical protein [Oscillatoria sp. Prado101]
MVGLRILNSSSAGGGGVGIISIKEEKCQYPLGSRCHEETDILPAGDCKEAVDSFPALPSPVRVRGRQTFPQPPSALATAAGEPFVVGLQPKSS